MQMKALFVLLCALYSFQGYAKSVRTIEADDGKVVLINTAIGYSTIVEFTSKPTSAVLGDQDAFKLEYVGNSITLKPLIPHAKSNLFVFTEFDRFNCTLRTVSSTEVDYIVKVSSPSRSYPVQPEVPKVTGNSSSTPTKTKTKRIGKTASWNGFYFNLRSSSQMKGAGELRGVTVFEFDLGSKRSPYSFSAGAFGVKQAGHFIPIESIYLDSVELKPGQAPIQGKIVLLNEEFHVNQPLLILFAVPGHIIQISLSGPTGSQGLKGK